MHPVERILVEMSTGLRTRDRGMFVNARVRAQLRRGRSASDSQGGQRRGPSSRANVRSAPATASASVSATAGRRRIFKPRLGAMKPAAESEGDEREPGAPPPADFEGSGPDSDRSAGSSNNADADRDSSASAEDAEDAEDADEPDSDDSSEMDEGECERRRSECLEIMVDLERQFTGLREQLYKERLSQVDFQLSEVRGGRSREYLGPLQRLQENMRSRIEVAGVLRQMRLENIRNKFEAEQQAALQNLKSEKSLSWDALHDELVEKIRKLEEDHQNVDLTWAGGAHGGARARARRKAVTVSGPFIVYMLDDQEIMEDWTIIKKALKRTIA